MQDSRFQTPSDTDRERMDRLTGHHSSLHCVGRLGAALHGHWLRWTRHARGTILGDEPRNASRSAKFARAPGLMTFLRYRQSFSAQARCLPSCLCGSVRLV